MFSAKANRMTNPRPYMRAERETKVRLWKVRGIGPEKCA
jgi:hypothetical protein